MKNLSLLLLALISTLFATTALAQTPEQARNLKINPTHTGSITIQNFAPPLSPRWTINFGQPISYPLIADGKVFVTVKNPSPASGTTLYALNAVSGATIWSFNLGGTYWWSASCYENGSVFAINTDGLLRSFNGATGGLNWSVQLPGQYFFTAPPTVLNGVVYLSGAGTGGTVYAVNANSGAVLWTAPVANGDVSSPAVTNEGVYVSYACPNVYKLNPATGALIWRYSTGCSGGGGSTPALHTGRLYVRDFTNTIFDSLTGTIVGNFDAKNTPAFSGDRGFFLEGPPSSGSVGTLRGRELGTNSVLWSFAGDGFLQSSVLLVNGHVYVGSSQGNLYAVNAATGQQVWATNTGDTIPPVSELGVAQPLTSFAAAEGLLVVPTSTKLIAYESSQDTTPPTLTFGSATPAPNAAGWNNTAVDIPFTTADDSSGVQSSDPASPLHFVAEGANQTQQVTVTDNAGNSATFTSQAVHIDLTQPSTVSNLSGEWFTAPVTVTLSATDNLSGVTGSFYRVDNGPTQTYTSPFSITSNGNHSVEFWSVDVAGNTETHHTQIVRIDSFAPLTQASLSGTAGTNGWYRTSVQVTLTANDNLSGVQSTFYQVDGGATQTYAGPFVVSAPGQHTINYWSVDNLGNTEATHSQVVKIDTAGPVVTASANPATAAKGPKAVLVIISGSVTDALSGVGSVSFNVTDEYGATQPSGAVTLQANGTYSFTLSLPATRQGWDKDGHLYVIAVSSADQAGNSGSATTTLRIN